MERRRAARVQTSILVAIEGVDDALSLRRGNISASGLYVELPESLGAVGTVQWLRLSSVDTARSIGVMAQVVRTITLREVARSTTYGVALEFMPESDAAAHALQEFVLYVLARKLSSTAMTAARRVTPPARSAIDTGGLRGVEIETAWPIVEGESLELTLRSSRSRKWLRCHARVGPVSRTATNDGEVFKSRLVLDELQGGDAPPISERELGEWLSRYVVPPEAMKEARGFFEGSLARIKLPTLLSLVEMDKMTGKLALRGDKETATLRVLDGRVLDATSSKGGAPRDVLRRALAWHDGEFEFHGGDVDDHDRIGMTTTALVLDLVRELDEATRPTT